MVVSHYLYRGMISADGDVRVCDVGSSRCLLLLVARLSFADMSISMAAAHECPSAAPCTLQQPIEQHEELAHGTTPAKRTQLGDV